MSSSCTMTSSKAKAFSDSTSDQQLDYFSRKKFQTNYLKVNL